MLDVNRTCRYLPLLSLVLLHIPDARAQSSFDLNLGFGSAHNSSIGGIDNLNSLNPFATCSIGAADPNCVSGPKLGGFFLGFGGGVMATKGFCCRARVS